MIPNGISEQLFAALFVVALMSPLLTGVTLGGAVVLVPTYPDSGTIPSSDVKRDVHDLLPWMYVCMVIHDHFPIQGDH